MSKITIIIPVFNAEEKIGRCIKSLLNQTYDDWKAVFVDDGSSDNSAAIISSYLGLDSRIILVKQANQGAGAARKKGIEFIDSELLCFLDSDDYYEPDFLKTLVNLQSETNADLVECAYYLRYKNRTAVNRLFSDYCVYMKDDFIKQVVVQTIIGGDEAVVLWNKVYKTQLFRENVIQYGSNFLEDYLINMQYYKKVCVYAYYNVPLTNYHITNDSLSKKCQSNFFKTLFETILPYKEVFMSELALDTDEYKIKNANWVINYIENYLKLMYNSREYRNTAFKVLNDNTTKKYAAMLKHNRLAKYISENKIKKACRYIFFLGVGFTIKRKMLYFKDLLFGGKHTN